MFSHRRQTPDFDAASAFPEVAAWRAAVRDGDWPRLHEMLSGLPDDDAQSFAVSDLGRLARSEHFYADVASTTGDTLAGLLYASRQVDIGWAARGTRNSGSGADEPSAGLRHHLRIADQALADITLRQPDNGAAWVLRLNAGRGLRLGQGEAWRRYRFIARYQPSLLPAQLQLLLQLCPRWGGCWDDAAAFARRCVADTPPGAPHALLVLRLHAERYRELGRRDGARYLRQGTVQAEIDQAAQRSVFHPAFRRDHHFYALHNAFAWAYGTAGRHDGAAAHFRAVGNHATPVPWRYSGDPAQVFTGHRARALRKG